MKEQLIVIDGNNILNRAFYGIMGNKMLMTNDGTYTNAVYGFLAILFKILEEKKPDYLVVTFDLKAPTARHKMYEGYKANRKGMPDELAQQMPIIKEILKAMNIDIIEKEGYEADDIMGTLSRFGEKQGLDVTIVSGDRDTFQLATDNTTIKIPRTKMGKTETEDFDRQKVIDTYGVEPKQLIEVKGLQGDTSDNIPGIPGIGEKTALSLIKKYKTIDNLYKQIEENKDDLKGKQREKIIQNKELAYLSKELGTINTKVPIEDTLKDFKVEDWDREKVLEIFKRLNFKRYIERFNLTEEKQENKTLEDLFKIIEIQQIDETLKIIKQQKKIYYYITTKQTNNPNDIIKEEINAIYIYNNEKNEIYYITNKNEKLKEFLKNIFEENAIEKYGFNLTHDYILLKQIDITMENLKYDAQVAAYILNSTKSKYTIEELAEEYLNLDIAQYIEEEKQEQINLFEAEQAEEKTQNTEKNTGAIYSYCIQKLYNITTQKLEEINALKLFNNIDMPTVEVLSNMQWNGMYVDKEELEDFGKELTDKLETITKIIYEMAGEEFNINSTKQLGEILFEKMQLPVIKKTKNGYSTDVDVLEKLKKEDPIIEQILEYRQLMKLNSTYVEGLKPYINPKTKRIHSFFHQTITATGRISSTEPNLQNIPTRFELGKRVRKVFKPENGYVYVDADYSQIELRVLASISGDKHMIEAFKEGQDIHKQAASKVFKTPIDEVTKEQRSNAKAVNFGIVYGISDFGLAEQLGIGRKQAKAYIDEYLTQYSGIKKFMDNIKEEAKENGYVETIFHRRRYIPELKSNNYMVRQFGARAAMNTPIQGTAADIMKIAMIKVFNEIKKRKLKSKIVLQVHDEMMIEAPIEEKEEIKTIIKNCMQTATELKVPLIAEISEANNWYDCK